MCPLIHTTNNILFQEFVSMDDVFKRNNWHICVNDKDRIAYTHTGFETEYFEIKKNSDNIYEVSFPLVNSTYQYNTTIRDHICAKNYLLGKFNEYINTRN